MQRFVDHFVSAMILNLATASSRRLISGLPAGALAVRKGAGQCGFGRDRRLEDPQSTSSGPSRPPNPLEFLRLIVKFY